MCDSSPDMAPPSPAPAALLPAPAAPAEPAAPAQKKPGKSKRFRPFGPPFHEVLYGQNGRKIRLKLDEPDGDEECPLTLAPIKDDGLEFLSPSARWFPAFPDVKKATLNCGHSFGALNILYHFARRNMTCPCCRGGFDSRLTLGCIPTNFRMTLSAKVQSELSADASEQVREDSQMAEAFLASDDPMEDGYLINVEYISLRDQTGTGGLRLRIRFYGEDDNTAVSIDVPLENPRRNDNTPNHLRNNNSGASNVFSLPPGPYRTIIEQQLADESTRSFSLAACLHVRDRTIDVACTDRVALDRNQNRVLATLSSLNNNSCFDLDLRRDGAAYTIAWLGWRTSSGLAFMI